MPSTMLPANRVKWEGYYLSNLRPVWSSEPDIEAVRAVATSALDEHCPVPEDTVFPVKVTFFAEGMYNKIYNITREGDQTEYLLRVSLPVDPIIKTRSEIATLAWIRGKVTIPVPTVIAWSSTARPLLGYEWILLKKLPGVTLDSVYREMSMDRKPELSRTLATFCTQTTSHEFNRIGSLVEDGTLNDPKIGKMADPSYTLHRRRDVPSDRGPFRNIADWFKSLINLQRDWVTTGMTLLEQSKDDPEADPEADDYEIDLENTDLVLDLCKRALALTDKMPHQNPTQACYLTHEDLNNHNILVDPETYKITGNIDWEMVATVPPHRAFCYPKAISDREPNDENEPPIPQGELPEGSLAWVIRERWECLQMRKAFDAELVKQGHEPYSTYQNDKALRWYRKFEVMIDLLWDSNDHTVKDFDRMERILPLLWGEHVETEYEDLRIPFTI